MNRFKINNVSLSPSTSSTHVRAPKVPNPADSSVIRSTCSVLRIHSSCHNNTRLRHNPVYQHMYPLIYNLTYSMADAIGCVALANNSSGTDPSSPSKLNSHVSRCLLRIIHTVPVNLSEKQLGTKSVLSRISGTLPQVVNLLQAR